MPAISHLSAASTVPGYSPLTLTAEWPKMGRLLFVVGSCTLGSIMNGFFVATFFVERSLRKVGNVFQACAGLSDLMITTVVMPVCSVVLLSGQWETKSLCYALQFVAMSSTYAYNFFFMFIAFESYYRLSRTSEKNTLFTRGKVATISVLVFTISFVTAGVGVYFGYDYNYCTRENFGNFYFKAATALVFQLVPFILTMTGLVSAAVLVRRRARNQLQYKRSNIYDCDNSSTALNLTVYIFFVVSWIPYLVIVHKFPNTSDGLFYHSVWFGLLRTVLSSFLYAFLDPNFRHAFAHLFNYCCCKNSLSSSLNSRHRRVPEYRNTFGDIRVHIMHQAINVPRFYSYRETQEL